MKTLKNNIIFYDDECPMCRLYTSAFTKTGMLDRNGRLPYAEAGSISCAIDKDRARNEIALVDTERHTVTYGIDSLMKILSHRFGFLRPLFRFKPFYSSMSVLYKFISYNRRVIIPSKEYNKPGACAPDFNLEHRLWYIGVINLLSVAMLTLIINFFRFNIISLNHIEYPFIFISSCVYMQSLTAGLSNREKFYEYMGNITTVIFLQCLFIAIMIPFGRVIPPDYIFAYILCTILIGTIEVWRRTLLLGLGWGIAFMYLFNIYMTICFSIYIRLIFILV